MSRLQVVFILVAVITILSALMVVSAKKTMHSALWLVLALMGVAVLLATLQASFFAVVELLVYIGAIAILILFAVMLTRGILEEAGGAIHKFWAATALASAGLFVGLVSSLSLWGGINTALVELAEGTEDIAAMGVALLNPGAYLVPFEVASVLLLAGMVAAIYLAVERKGGQE